jgi:7-cyano-7-deazaguanine synthase
MSFRPLILLSGGMDSTTLFGYAIAKMGAVDPAGIFINYGQRHRVEMNSAVDVARYYESPLHTLDLKNFGASVTSALTGHGEVPHGHYAADNMAATVVPNRNATLLMAAAGVAASHGYTDVLTAVHAGDHAIYPDCRPEFITAANQTALLGCGVAIQAPFVQKSKTDIAAIGDELGAPLSLTWSCYEGNPDGHCGRCGTCVERREAFHLAGVADPTHYRDPEFWKQAVR